MVLRRQKRTVRTPYRRWVSTLLCLLYCTLALLSPLSSAASEKTGVLDADSVHNIVTQGIFSDDLAFEAGKGDALTVPGTYPGDAAINPEQPEVAVVPLPAAIWLFGSALVGFVMMSNRR